MPNNPEIAPVADFHPGTRTILFLAPEGLRILPLAAAMTVLAAASRFLWLEDKPGYAPRVVSRHGGLVSPAEGPAIAAERLSDLRDVPVNTIVSGLGASIDAARHDQELIALAHLMGCAPLRFRSALADPQSCTGMAFALVEEDCGRAIAKRVASAIGISTEASARPLHRDERFAALHASLAHNIADPHLTVETLASKASMSTRNFSRVYKEKTGETPARALEMLRLNLARLLLEETDQRIESVARRCGFGAEERMRTSFQRHLGVCPRAYRSLAAAKNCPHG